MPKPVGKARPPKILSREARREWRRLAPELERLGLLTSADAASFGVYCQVVADLERTESIIRADGEVIRIYEPATEAPTGEISAAAPRVIVKMARHPLITTREQLRARLLAAAAEFGLTPSGRARLSVDKRKRYSERLAKLRERARNDKDAEKTA